MGDEISLCVSAHFPNCVGTVLTQRCCLNGDICWTKKVITGYFNKDFTTYPVLLALHLSTMTKTPRQLLHVGQ